MVEFAGWEMPVQYTGIGAEHRAVRTKAGIFDVSHMGEIIVRGPQALSVVQHVTCNDASRLRPNEAQYSALLTEQGTFVDDIIVYRLGSDLFLICVNASNAEKDFQWVSSHAAPGASIEDHSDDYFQIALQGPEALSIVGTYGPIPPKPFTLIQTDLAGSRVLLSRTGYTGEDGLEIYGNPKDAEKVWTLLMEKGATPCGLGARDTLRIEASYPLYGHEIDDQTHPYESRLDWIVKMDKGDFIGRQALQDIIGSSQEMLLARLLVGMRLEEQAIPRQGCKVFSGASETGLITSGTKSPLCDSPMALGYVAPQFAAVGTKIQIDIHHKKREAIIVPLPFYRRAEKKP